MSLVKHPVSLPLQGVSQESPAIRSPEYLEEMNNMIPEVTKGLVRRPGIKYHSHRDLRSTGFQKLFDYKGTPYIFSFSQGSIYSIHPLGQEPKWVSILNADVNDYLQTIRDPNDLTLEVIGDTIYLASKKVNIDNGSSNNVLDLTFDVAEGIIRGYPGDLIVTIDGVGTYTISPDFQGNPSNEIVSVMDAYKRAIESELSAYIQSTQVVYNQGIIQIVLDSSKTYSFDYDGYNANLWDIPWTSSGPNQIELYTAYGFSSTTDIINTETFGDLIVEWEDLNSEGLQRQSFHIYMGDIETPEDLRTYLLDNLEIPLDGITINTGGFYGDYLGIRLASTVVSVRITTYWSGDLYDRSNIYYTDSIWPYSYRMNSTSSIVLPATSENIESFQTPRYRTEFTRNTDWNPPIEIRFKKNTETNYTLPIDILNWNNTNQNSIYMSQDDFTALFDKQLKKVGEYLVGSQDGWGYDGTWMYFPRYLDFELDITDYDHTQFNMANPLTEGLNSVPNPTPIRFSPPFTSPNPAFLYTGFLNFPDFSGAFGDYRGYGVQKVLFYQNRLLLVTDYGIIASKTGDYSNFAPDDPNVYTDVDPIELLVIESGDRLYDAQTFNDRLILFGEKNQYSISHTGIFSFANLTVTTTTSYRVPGGGFTQKMGSQLLFSSSQQQGSSIRQYFVQPNTQVNTANVLTNQLKDYIPKNAKQSAYSKLQDILIVHSDVDPYTVYVYKQFYRGQDIVQSAWFKWTFPIKVYDILEIDNKFYFIGYHHSVAYSNNYTYYELSLDLSNPNPMYVDFARPSDSTLGLSQLYNKKLSQLGEGWAEETEETPGTHQGIPYNSTLTLSPWYLKDENNRILHTGKHMLTSLKIGYLDTWYFQVEDQYVGREPYIRPFSNLTSDTYDLYSMTGDSNILDTIKLGTGEFNMYLGGISEKHKISISSGDSINPMNLTGIYLQGNWTPYNRASKRYPGGV